ncbi:ankyrin repeat-containing protein At5g02620-like isoform X2 [Phoenix dactylifera]|uniref:Ankyrin repeat-containing protein At5g02620-like isoform X2 n=1 Tax=Phoenix dactylifera TaxID=42345 RepID=A0A8B8ZY35_PHODC|nr:ankyrin repeat-containing protein At5g02620-like isoform X2 [Phoenix dactylifera]
MAEESITSQTAQINSNLEVPSGEVQPGRIPMNLKLLKSARSGDRRILDELLRPGDTRLLLGVTLEGNTALHIAASRGHHEIVEICRREISIFVAPNTRLDTPLHCAARAGYASVVTSIIEFAKQKGIKERVLRARNKDEANALHVAAKYNHVGVANVMMNEDVGLASMLNEAGMSPLYLAIATGSLDIAKALLQSFSMKNDSPAYYAGPNKNTALHAAVLLSSALYGHHDTVKLLLKRDPSTAYQPDANGSFPIHMAASMGNVHILQQILKQCPATDELLDKKGKNFLHVAFKRRRLDAVKKIISRRQDLRKLLNDQDSKGNTPLHTAVKMSDKASVYFLLRDKTVCVNVINHDGFTPLDLAYQLSDRGMQFLMNAKCCIANCLALTKALSGPQEIFHDLESGKLSSDETKEKLSGDDMFKKESSNVEDKEIRKQVDLAKNDKFKKESSNVEDKEISKQVDLAKNFGIATVLIATVTFAAGFTVPGGYIADDHPGHGTAVLAKEYAFKVFLVSDASALVCSIVATFWLMHAGTSTVDTPTRIRAFLWALNFLWVGLQGMCTAFAMGIYVVLPPSCKRISILLCIIALGAPLLARMVANYKLCVLLITVRIRQGYRQCNSPTLRPYDKKRLGGLVLGGRRLIFDLLRTLGVYAMFFLLAML